MSFVDSAKIYVKAGSGGKGCTSFYSDMFLRGKKRPDGGDGGKGGDVIAVADPHLQTLLDFRFQQHYKGQNGKHGSGQGKTGRNGQDCVLRLPCGTVIWDDKNNMLMKELLHPGQSVVLARGGVGGMGNIHRRKQKQAQQGEEHWIRLELKVIADIGLVGFPNAGKSTLVSAVSNVKSKAANYPFTTKSPVLGFIKGEDVDLVMADLPGLIEGAHLGKGLGHQFLKHAERTRILVHVIDMAGSDGRDPWDDYQKISDELDKYSHDLADKQRIIVANKMDVPQAKENLKRFQTQFNDKIFEISAFEKKGLRELLNHLFTLVS